MLVFERTGSLEPLRTKHSLTRRYLHRTIYISPYLRNLDEKYNLLSLMTGDIYYFINFNSEV